MAQTNFTEEESYYLLELVHSEEYQNKFGSNRCHIDIWSEIAIKLSKRFSREKLGRQCNIKYDNLKKKYGALRRNVEAGDTTPIVWPFYKTLDEIFSNDSVPKPLFIRKIEDAVDREDSESSDIESNHWPSNEIKDFLHLCRDRKIVRKMGENDVRLSKLFEVIAADMESLGYKRSVTQLLLEFKRLRTLYQNERTAKEANENYETSFEYYTLMEEALQTEDKPLPDVKFGSTGVEDPLHDLLKDINDVQTDYEAEEDNEAFDKGNAEDTYDENYVPSTKRAKLSTNLTSGAKSKTTGTEDTIERFVQSFHKAQEQLQASFFKQQLALQKQQQEWEEKILDEEREFFTKVLNSLSR